MSLKTYERRKYEKAWTIPEYRNYAPGEILATGVLADIPKGAKVIDFGSGTGRGALKIHEAGYPVVMIDHADNCLDREVKKAINPRFRFLEWCLWDPLHVKGDYGFCTDVMEHIPPQKVPDVLDNIKTAVEHGFFNISTIDDYFGKQIGEPLHLTVMPWHTWVELISQRWPVLKTKIGPGEVSIWF